MGKTLYTKDKLHRITLRLNQEQFDYVTDSASALGVSPSDFFRMVINSTMAAHRNTLNNLSKEIARAAVDELKKEGVVGRENDKTDFHSKL